MKRAVTIAIAMLFLTAGAYAADAGHSKLVQKAFHFQYKAADKAATVIKTLLSSEGSLSIQPASNTLVVTDRAENLNAITAAVGKFDTQPHAFRLDLKLVAASRITGNPPVVPDDLREVSTKLSGVLRFNSFEKVGAIDVEAKESDDVRSDVGASYRAEFTFGEYDPVSDSVKLNDFRLSRFEGADKANQKLSPVLKTSLNLKVGQTVVLGVSKLPDSQKALMLVLVARRTR